MLLRSHPENRKTLAPVVREKPIGEQRRLTNHFVYCEGAFRSASAEDLTFGRACKVCQVFRLLFCLMGRLRRTQMSEPEFCLLLALLCPHESFPVGVFCSFRGDSQIPVCSLRRSGRVGPSSLLHRRLGGGCFRLSCLSAEFCAVDEKRPRLSLLEHLRISCYLPFACQGHRRSSRHGVHQVLCVCC